MNKAELVAAIADESELSKAKAEHALNATLETIKKAAMKMMVKPNMISR